TVRECPLIAGSIRVLLEEKLLHRRRNRNHALVSLRLPADVGLGLDEQDSQIEIQIVPRQVFDLTFPHSCEQNRGEQPALVLTTSRKELPDLLGRHEPRQRSLRHAELLDVRHRIYEEMILLDGPTEEREETPQLVVDGPHRDARMNGMSAEPSVLRVCLHRSPLRVASQL